MAETKKSFAAQSLSNASYHSPVQAKASVAMMTAAPTVFLLTDFGTTDHYVAAMKAVILSRCPGCTLVDITHEVAPQAVGQAAYLLENIREWLPKGAVVLAVVDPGVGTARQPAVFYYKSHYYVGPNNGLFSFLPPDTTGRALDQPAYWLPAISHTFHGRDIFAPCAAYIATGGDWARLGSVSVAPAALATAPVPSETGTGRIIYFDHFGNAVTSIRPMLTENDGLRRQSIEVPGKVHCPVLLTYGKAAPGSVLACIGSSGRLEIAVNGGNARERIGLALNDFVIFNSGADEL